MIYCFDKHVYYLFDLSIFVNDIRKIIKNLTQVSKREFNSLKNNLRETSLLYIKENLKFKCKKELKELVWGDLVKYFEADPIQIGNSFGTIDVYHK